MAMSNLYILYEWRLFRELKDTVDVYKRIMDNDDITPLYYKNPTDFVAALKTRHHVDHMDFWCDAQCILLIHAPIPIVQLILSLDIPVEDAYCSSVVHLLCLSVLQDPTRERFVLNYFERHRHVLLFQQADSFRRTPLFYNTSVDVYQFLVGYCDCDPHVVDAEFYSIAEFGLFYHLFGYNIETSDLFNNIYVPLFSGPMLKTALRRRNLFIIQHILSLLPNHDEFRPFRAYISNTPLPLDEVTFTLQFLSEHFGYGTRMHFLTKHLTNHFSLFPQFLKGILSRPEDTYKFDLATRLFPQLIPTLSTEDQKQYTRAIRVCNSSQFVNRWLRCVIGIADDEIRFVLKERPGLLRNAVNQRNLELAHMHLAYGADVNHQNLDGQTPLHYLYLRGMNQKEFYDLLVENGAHEDILDCHGNTAVSKLRDVRKVWNLACLAARAIPDEHYRLLPERLVQFVDWHHKYRVPAVTDPRKNAIKEDLDNLTSFRVDGETCFVS